MFAEYEALDIGCVLVSVMVQDAFRPVIAQAYAGLHGCWIGYSAPAQFSHGAPAGIISPGGRWLARCPANGQPLVIEIGITLVRGLAKLQDLKIPLP